MSLSSSPGPEVQAPAVSDLPAAEPAPAAPRAGRVRWLVGGTLTLAVAAPALWFALASHGAPQTNRTVPYPAVDEDEVKPLVLSVNTVFPRKTTLQRILQQPCTIRPWAQVELYAKASGYLKSIQHLTTPQQVADVVAQQLGLTATAPAMSSPGLARMAVAAAVAWDQAPEIDVGSPVARGQLLLEVEVPERRQEIVEKASLLLQRQAELEQARTALAVFEAGIAVADAQKAQAEADVERYKAECTFRQKEYNRNLDLAKSRTVTQELADEKESQLDAARAALQSARAKLQGAQADALLVSSKLLAAQADLKVKEALIQVARDALHHAEIVAEYSHLHAPFDGLVTSRSVDVGDFVQNATSGQSRELMTITAVDQVKAVLQARESEALLVRVGAEAAVEVHGSAAGTILGRVARVNPLLQQDTRTMQVEIDLDNRGRRLLPGMYGQVTLTLLKIPNAQAIPATAVYSRRGENFILQVQNGVARRQAVRLRYDDGKQVEVVKLTDSKEVPLDGTEELIVSNKGEIAEGQQVRATRLNSAAAVAR